MGAETSQLADRLPLQPDNTAGVRQGVRTLGKRRNPGRLERLQHL
jgi:hypothetical protein